MSGMSAGSGDPRLDRGPARDAAQAAFLVAAGWGRAKVAPLAGDASDRRYLRLRRDGGGRAVLMDSPPARGEDVRPFLTLTEILRGRGFSAPEVYAADPEAGFLLLEDLGDALFARVAEAEPAREPELYAVAADLLSELQAEPADALPLPPYDGVTLLREAALVWEWYWPGAAGGPVPEAAVAAIRSALEAALVPVAGARSALALRDYHAENLVWLPERRGTARVGLLDHQDALRGHGAYDLVSLLEDARRDVSEAAAARAEARFLAATGTDPAAHAAARATLGAQRNLKILGIFARLARRDGKPAYLALLPRVWGHLRRDLAHPALADLARALEGLPAPDAAVRARLAA
ncbi:MAG: phosphotransferase [Paracoccaceae bacterium]